MENHSKKTARKFWEVTPVIMKAMAVEERRGEHNFNMVHYRILRMLSDRACNLSDIAEGQNVSLPSISATVQTMVSRGWLQRKRSQNDRRVVFLTVTAHGRQVLEEETERMLDWMAKRLEPLSDKELDAIEQGMEMLNKAFEKDRPVIRQAKERIELL